MMRSERKNVKLKLLILIFHLTKYDPLHMLKKIIPDTKSRGAGVHQTDF